MMYRRMNPKQLEKVIEDLKKRKEDKLRAELAKMAENPAKYKVIEDFTDGPSLDRP